MRNIGLVSVVTMGSRVLGLGRDMLTTAVFGASGLNSAFVTAFTLPNLFRRLLGEGALTAALVPTLHEEAERGRREGAYALLSQVASWLLVVTGVLVTVAMIGLAMLARSGDALAGWGVPAGALARWVTAAELAVVLFPYLVLVCLAAAFSATLQTFGRFLEPALSPVWLNLSMIGLLGGAVWLGWAREESGRMWWLCAGVLLGGFLQMLVPALALVRAGWRPRFDLGRSAGLRQIALLMGPTVLGSAIYLVNMAVSRMFGLSINEAAATVLNLSTRLMELPIGVFAIAISTVVFPQIARHAARGEGAELAGAYRRGMRLILLINVPAAVGMAVLAAPVVRLLFERGAFAEGDPTMGPVVMVCALGLPFLSFVSLALRAFYARKDTSTPVRAAGWSFAVNVAASLALMGPWSTVGLALAGTLAVMVQAFYLQGRLTAVWPELAFGHLARDLAKVVVASVFMGVAVAAAWRGWSSQAGDGVLLLAAGLALCIGLGVLVYGAAAWVLRVEGRDELAALLKRRGRA
ncbi:MAG: murein biosynthesis integral membrane protein MurJ [Verrucomicrobiota bacterium]